MSRATIISRTFRVIAFLAFAAFGAVFGVPLGYFLLDLQRVLVGATFTGWSLWFAFLLSPYCLVALLLAVVSSWLGGRVQRVTNVPTLRVALTVAVTATVVGATWATMTGFPS